jgi:hypothetical protein
MCSGWTAVPIVPIVQAVQIVPLNFRSAGSVIPVKTGIQVFSPKQYRRWIPAFAGMTIQPLSKDSM